MKEANFFISLKNKQTTSLKAVLFSMYITLVYNFLIKYKIISFVSNIDGILAFSPSIPVIV